ncbi:MAG: trehalase family glycosidase [Bacteroidota bacterium]
MPDRYHPDRALGALFEAVQRAPLFADAKTFADALPREAPSTLVARYEAARHQPGFDLRAFVDTHFDLPRRVPPALLANVQPDLASHLRTHWPALIRVDDAALAPTSSLLPLPHPYVVPGGHLREMHYWHSYFIMLGLAASGQMELVRGMLENFARLIDDLGFIPSATRTYHLSRSQLPFFAPMVLLLAHAEGLAAARTYLPSLEREYAFWMDGETEVSAEQPAVRHVVRLPDGTLLNRYWDRLTTPRPASFREDVARAASLPEALRAPFYRHLRAASASGWDLSSRWLADGITPNTIHTTDIVPVDLNVMLWILEQTLALLSDGPAAEQFLTRSAQRAEALVHLTWKAEAGFFHDYDFVAGTHTPTTSLAGLFPLYAGLATPDQAQAVVQTVAQHLLADSGFLTTTAETGLPWDAPYGWAPLQWIAIHGLRRYNYHPLADAGQIRWLTLNESVYLRTGQTMETYDVQSLMMAPTYPPQDGYAWTNGVALALMARRPAVAAPLADLPLP